MKQSWKELLLRVAILLVGLTVAHLGVTLFLLADLGADPFNVLVQGLFRTLSGLWPAGPLTHGYTHVGVSVLIILILLVVDRSYIKIGTVLCMVCGGPIIDVFTALLTPLFGAGQSYPVRLVTVTLGCGILAFGMTIVIKSDAGTGPNDLVAVVLSDKTHGKFSILRVLVDGSFMVVGFLLGGALGVGTAVCVCLVGPVAGFFLPHSQRMVEAVVGRLSPAGAPPEEGGN